MNIPRLYNMTDEETILKIIKYNPFVVSKVQNKSSDFVLKALDRNIEVSYHINYEKYSDEVRLKAVNINPNLIFIILDQFKIPLEELATYPDKVLYLLAENDTAKCQVIFNNVNLPEGYKNLPSYKKALIKCIL